MSRTRPYTTAGLARVPCAHCGAPGAEQWEFRPCATGTRRWYALCAACDIALNELVLGFMRVPNAAELIANYRERTS
jgi:hypothetical protein